MFMVLGLLYIFLLYSWASGTIESYVHFLADQGKDSAGWVHIPG